MVRQKREAHRLGVVEQRQIAFNLHTDVLANGPAGAGHDEPTTSVASDNLLQEIVDLIDDDINSEDTQVVNNRNATNKKKKRPPFEKQVLVLPVGTELADCFGPLGCFKFQFTDAQLTESACFEPGFRLYFSLNTGKAFLLPQEQHVHDSVQGNGNRTVSAFPVILKLPERFLNAVSRKEFFRCVVSQFDFESKEVEVTVFATRRCLTVLEFPAQAPPLRPVNHSLTAVMNFFYGFDSSVADYPVVGHRDNLPDFYEQLHCHQQALRLNDLFQREVDVQHPSLIPHLRRYQKSAVWWMLWRESLSESTTHDDTKSLHPLYVEVFTKQGTPFFYNGTGGIITTEKPLMQGPCPGGILAEEMGLGKTVEVLALVLLHPKQEIVTNSSRLNNCSAGAQGGCRCTVETCNHMISDCHFVTENLNGVVSELLEEVVCKVSGNIQTEEAFKKKLLESPHKRKAAKQTAATKKTKLAAAAADETNGNSKPVSKPALNSEFLSCTCGVDKEAVKDSDCIQCTKCASFQHAACVGWTKMREVLMNGKIPTYLCPDCVVSREPLECGATLIISPSSISHQWYLEIQKHVRSSSFNVFIYGGVRDDGYVQPSFLAEHDIVITTYETLRFELNFTDLPPNSRLRHPKRFRVTPSPLTAVKWWRICLDEAQMVESASSKAAEMCMKLHAKYRWCITGTPVQRSIDDLYGLCLFCGLDPYWVRCWWDKLLYRPYRCGVIEPLIDAMAPVLWRTEKCKVVDQLGIPDQEEKIYKLQFSPVEEHFYRRTQEECSQKAAKVLSKFPDRSLPLEGIADHLDSIMLPLLRLRQACCHPQVVRGHFLPIQKSTITMEEVLEQMIKKTKTEAEDQLRAFGAALNGIAGIYILAGDINEAAETYRSLLRNCRDLETRVRTDPLQMVHTLHNLGTLLQENRTLIAPTTRDDSLLREAEDLKVRYLSATLESVGSTKSDLEKLKQKVSAAQKEFKEGENWWAEVVDRSSADALKSSALIEKMLLEIGKRKLTKAHTIEGKFRDCKGLLFVLNSLNTKLKASRKALLQSVAILCATEATSPELTAAAALCHLRSLKQNDVDRCLICVADSAFDVYEENLYNFREKKGMVGGTTIESADVDQESVRILGDLRRGTWSESALEMAIKALLSYARLPSSSVELELIEFAQQHLRMFDLWKKEFRALRACWMAYRDHVSQRDEVSMAIERLQLKTVAECHKRSVKNRNAYDEKIVNLVEQHELPQLRIQLEADKFSADAALQRKLGQLTYLQTLKKAQFGENAETEPESPGNPQDCPICRIALGESWGVLNCGHYFCCPCTRELLKRCSVGGLRRSIRCPICRDLTAESNITFVVTKQKVQEQEDWEVKGSYSTKVEAIVRCLLSIQKSEPAAKCLVFSGWTEVLNIVEEALTINGIQCAALYRSGKFQKNLALFKTSPNVNVLLLPFHCGANGLNIVEATHVILVEPLLNKAAELQAIGRVHRIGQRRKTTVHRFLISGSIEQQMVNLMDDQNVDLSSNVQCAMSSFQTSEFGLLIESKLTVGDIKNLFE